jgi:hypothetical protein
LAGPANGPGRLEGEAVLTGFAYWGPAPHAEGYTLEVYTCPYSTKALCANIPDSQRTALPFAPFFLSDSGWLGKQQLFQTWINNNVDGLFQFPGSYWTDIDG